MDFETKHITADGCNMFTMHITLFPKF